MSPQSNRSIELSGVYNDRWLQTVAEEREIRKGGEGSGHHGHAGRPGQRGGSAPATSSVELGRGMTDARRKNTEAVLGMLPAEHVNGVKSIEFLDYDEMADAYGYRIANAEANHRSGEDGSEIALKVAPQGGDAFAGNLDQPSQQAILVHEIGHSVHTRLAPSEFGLTGEPSPLNSRIQDLYGSSDRGSLGELSESSYKEYFAEGYNHYVMYPDVLKSTDANLYNLLRDEVFDGQEYGQ